MAIHHFKGVEGARHSVYTPSQAKAVKMVKSKNTISVNLSKQELIQRIDWKVGTIKRQNNVNEISGAYKINVYKNKSLIHSISMGWKDNPHGARFNEVKDLASTLMTAYQDYESLIEIIEKKTKFRILKKGKRHMDYSNKKLHDYSFYNHSIFREELKKIY